MVLLEAITVIWLTAASITDLKKREVSDWLSFSLLTIALAIKASESILAWSLTPILSAIAGVILFAILANILYYGKIFAGGDAKLLIAMGAIIPSWNFLSNMLIMGGVYGVVYSIGLALTNSSAFGKELRKTGKNKKYFLLILTALFIASLITDVLLFELISGILVLVALLHFFTSAVEKACLIKEVNPKDLTEGDWLFKDIKIRNKVIKANFQGLTKNQIKMIRKSNKRVYVKYGIPFVPVFFFAFSLTIWWGNAMLLLVA